MNSCDSIYDVGFLYIRKTVDSIVCDMCDIFCKKLYKFCSIYGAMFLTICKTRESMVRKLCDFFCKILYKFVTIYGLAFMHRLLIRVYGVAYHETIRKLAGARPRHHIW